MKVVYHEDDPKDLWTVAEFAEKIGVKDKNLVRIAIQRLGIERNGRRLNGKRGRQPSVYSYRYLDAITEEMRKVRKGRRKVKAEEGTHLTCTHLWQPYEQEFVGGVLRVTSVYCMRCGVVTALQALWYKE